MDDARGRARRSATRRPARRSRARGEPAAVPPGRDHRAQRSALDELHRDEQRAVGVLAEVVDVDRVRVAELRDGLGLGIEPAQQELARRDSSGRSSFTATVRFSEICSARYTAPMPPSPSFGQHAVAARDLAADHPRRPVGLPRQIRRGLGRRRRRPHAPQNRASSAFGAWQCGQFTAVRPGRRSHRAAWCRRAASAPRSDDRRRARRSRGPRRHRRAIGDERRGRPAAAAPENVIPASASASAPASDARSRVDEAVDDEVTGEPVGVDPFDGQRRAAHSPGRRRARPPPRRPGRPARYPRNRAGRCRPPGRRPSRAWRSARLDGSTARERCATFTEMRVSSRWWWSWRSSRCLATPASADEPASDELREDNDFGPVILIESIEIARQHGDPDRADPSARCRSPPATSSTRATSGCARRASRCSRSASSATSRSRCARAAQRGQVDPRGARRRARHGRAQPAVVRHEPRSRRTGSAPTSASATCSASASARRRLHLRLARRDRRQPRSVGRRAPHQPTRRCSARGGARNGALTLVHGSETYRVAGDPGRSERPRPARVPVPPVRRPRGPDLRRHRAVAAVRRAARSSRSTPICRSAPTRDAARRPDRPRSISTSIRARAGSSPPGSASTATRGPIRSSRTPAATSPSTAELGSSLLGGATTSRRCSAATSTGGRCAAARHAIGLQLAGGVVIGDAPRFDRIHIADVDRMLTPRALGLVLSAAAPLDILGTRRDKPTYGDLGGSATLEYAFQLFRGIGQEPRLRRRSVLRRRPVGARRDRRTSAPRDTSLRDALPIDISPTPACASTPTSASSS